MSAEDDWFQHCFVCREVIETALSLPEWISRLFLTNLEYSLRRRTGEDGATLIMTERLNGNLVK